MASKRKIAQSILQRQQIKLKKVEKQLQEMLLQIKESINALKVEELQIKCNVIDEENKQTASSINADNDALQREPIKIEEFYEGLQYPEQQHYLLKQKKSMMDYKSLMNAPSTMDIAPMNEMDVNCQQIDLNMPPVNSMNLEFFEENEEFL